MKIKWLAAPREQNYTAAALYLSLAMTPAAAKSAAKRMHNARVIEFEAKDIFRASGLPLLGVSDSHVKKEMHHISKKKKLPPLLLYRDGQNNRLIIADGYHRLCAVYKVDEDAMIPCKIV